MRLRAAEEIAEYLKKQWAGRTFLLAAVDGPGGSGKSAAAAQAGQAVDAVMVHVDDFYLPSRQQWSGPGEAKPIGADFDWRRLQQQVLIPLTEGRAAEYQRYDWGTDALEETHTVAPQGIVIVEGIYALRRELRGFYHAAVWVDCPRPLRWARGLARDGEDAAEHWQQWMRDEDRYITEHRPKEAAQLVVSGCTLIES